MMTLIRNNQVLLRTIKYHNKEWFSKDNKKFFGDINYYGMYSEKTGERYLVRSTYAWTDMFGGERKLHYRINKIEENFKIGDLINDTFESMNQVLEWLKNN